MNNAIVTNLFMSPGRAKHLLPEANLLAVAPSSGFNSDDLEAIHTQEIETGAAKASIGQATQHKSWIANDVLNGDTISISTSLDKIVPPEGSSSAASSTPKVSSKTDLMPFSSSPVLYPPSSSPPVLTKKRKLFQPFPKEPGAKKNKIIGGFLDDLEEDVDQGANAIRDAEVGDALLPEVEHNISSPIQPQTKVSNTDVERSRSPSLPPLARPMLRKVAAKTTDLQTSNGPLFKVALRTRSQPLTYEETVAQRSVTAAGRAKKAYYGIEIHKLMDEARIQKELDDAQKEFEEQSKPMASVENTSSSNNQDTPKTTQSQMWTEKYRAKKFTELVGDERTHRSVLRWLKAWDEVVFPGSTKSKPKRIFEDKDAEHEQKHRKILLLTGPPGLGKTTLAHVCARQAGYEVLEINASDDRSRDVVNGRIKDALGTETVRGIKEHGKARKAGRPICVVVDEVDGVVTGSGSNGGEGGFMKTLIDLVQLDQRNSSASDHSDNKLKAGKRRGDKFRLLRPLILICNDIYAPSLRPLRTSSFAEIVHVRKPPLDKVMSRLKAVFEKESIPCDNDAIRRLCESTWGLGTRKQNSTGNRGAGEGDIRGVLVQGEWIAHKLRSASVVANDYRLTRKWIETHLADSQLTNGPKGMGRGGTREVVERVFIEGADLPNLPTALSADETRLVSESKVHPIGVANLRKRAAIVALREMIDTCGDHDRLVTDCFATYLTRVFQDDVQLSKPNASYEWLHFHDCLSSRIFAGQEWELNPYLSSTACGFHNLFAAVGKGSQGWLEEKKDGEEMDNHPFGGLKADFTAYEAEKQNRSVLTELQGIFSASMLRLFSSVDNMATELMPNVSKILAPEVKPVVVGGSGGATSTASVRKESEKNCVRNAVRAMEALNVSFEKVKIEIEGGGAHAHGGFAYRMEPPLDTLTMFHMDKSSTGSALAPVRYAVRQVLDQELRKAKILQNSIARHARSSDLQAGQPTVDSNNKENIRPLEKTDLVPIKGTTVKRDFFGRVVNQAQPKPSDKSSLNSKSSLPATAQDRVWVSFHEGFSNAVRKPITLKELMESF